MRPIKSNKQETVLQRSRGLRKKERSYILDRD